MNENVIDTYIDELPKSLDPSTIILRPTGETLEETLIVYNQILTDLEKSIDLIKNDIKDIKNKLNM